MLFLQFVSVALTTRAPISHSHTLARAHPHRLDLAPRTATKTLGSRRRLAHCSPRASILLICGNDGVRYSTVPTPLLRTRGRATRFASST